MIVRRKRWCAGVACACTAFLGGSTLLADATITRDDRFLETSASVTDFGGTVDGPFTSLTPMDVSGFAGAFNQSIGYDLLSPAAAAEADSLADQVSTLDGTTTFSSITATGNANVDGNTEFDAISSQAFAESNFEFDFEILVAHDFTLTGALNTRSSGTTVRAKLFTVGGGTEYYSLTAEGTIDGMGTLPAGEYTLQLLARSNRAVADGTIYNSDASYDNVVLTLVAIPEPATLALLGLGGLVMVRSRRS